MIGQYNCIKPAFLKIKKKKMLRGLVRVVGHVARFSTASTTIMTSPTAAHAVVPLEARVGTLLQQLLAGVCIFFRSKNCS
jgi:hypothetical protein